MRVGVPSISQLRAFCPIRTPPKFSFSPTDWKRKHLWFLLQQAESLPYFSLCSWCLHIPFPPAANGVPEYAQWYMYYTAHNATRIFVVWSPSQVLTAASPWIDHIDAGSTVRTAVRF